MFKWIIIVIGLVFALIGYKKTWYPSWALLFNILVSVYTSIMITPQIVDASPVIGKYLGSFAYSVFILTNAAIIFAVMRFLAFKFFISGHVISFPRILNTAGSAVLGFLTGSIIAGFLLFLITITPLFDFSVVKSFMQNKQTPDKVNTVMLTACNFIHNISLQPCPTAIEKQMEKILADWQGPQAQQAEKPAHLDPNKVETAE
jgi:hypothetical protein